MPANLSLVRGTSSFGTGKFTNGLLGGVYGTTASGAWDSSIGTVEAWVKRTATSLQVVAGNDNVSNSGIWIGVAANGGVTGNGSGTPPQIGGIASNLNDGNWHHIAYTFDGTNESIYADGARADTRARATPFVWGTGTYAIGGFGAATGFDFTGAIDEVRISNIVRYTGTSYTVPTAAFTDDANTIALYHLETDGSDSHVSSGGTTIAPNDANIIYSPYNWDVTSTRAKTINPGAYFRMGLIATGSFTLNFDMTAVSSPNPILKYRIDGDGWVTATLAATVSISLPTSNAWGNHTLEVVVAATSEFVTRWTPQNAHVSFTGISGSVSATFPLQQRAYNVLVFGDSITEGYKSAKNVTTPDGSDATVVWSYLLGTNLGAEVGVVGFGGQGWSAGGTGGVPAFTSAYANLWSGQARVWTPTPDAIVVNMGENGGAVQATVQSWITTLLGVIPSTTKVLIMRPFSGSGAAALSAAVTALANSRVTYVDTTGWWSSADSGDGQHPWGYASVAKLAPLLASAVRGVVTGVVVGFYRRDSSGAALPVYTKSAP